MESINMKPNISDFYKEGCEALRHYSKCVMHIRTITIAQGFVVISTAIYLLNENHYYLTLGLSFFGLVFSGILHVLQGNYGKHLETILDLVMSIEGQACGDNSCEGPWSTYYIPRKSRFNKTYYKYIVYYGPIFLLLLGILVIFIFTLIKIFL